jgi:hypothetical protein
MARPTKLTPELIEKAKTYLGTCIDTPVYTEKGALTYVSVNLPSKVGLALYLGIDKTTVDDWCKVPEQTFPITHNEYLKLEKSDYLLLKSEFSCIVKEIMSEQEKRLINNGLGGLYKEKTNAMLLSKHGYATEKTETDITTGGEKISSPVLPELIAEADRLLKEKKLTEQVKEVLQ